MRVEKISLRELRNSSAVVYHLQRVGIDAGCITEEIPGNKVRLGILMPLVSGNERQFVNRKLARLGLKVQGWPK